MEEARTGAPCPCAPAEFGIRAPERPTRARFARQCADAGRALRPLGRSFYFAAGETMYIGQSQKYTPAELRPAEAG